MSVKIDWSKVWDLVNVNGDMNIENIFLNQMKDSFKI